VGRRAGRRFWTRLIHVCACVQSATSARLASGQAPPGTAMLLLLQGRRQPRRGVGAQRGVAAVAAAA
jgi:hypothetical protein